MRYHEILKSPGKNERWLERIETFRKEVRNNPQTTLDSHWARWSMLAPRGVETAALDAMGEAAQFSSGMRKITADPFAKVFFNDELYTQDNPFDVDNPTPATPVDNSTPAASTIRVKVRVRICLA